jgi:hypothetical protein
MKKTLATIGAVAALAGGVVLNLPKKGCVAAPEGVTDCKRKGPHDKEPRYFGAGNSFPAREASGACVPMPPDSCSGGE